MGRYSDALLAILAAVPVIIAFKFAVAVLFGATHLLFGVPRLPMYLPSLIDWIVPVNRGADDLPVDTAANIAYHQIG